MKGAVTFRVHSNLQNISTADVTKAAGKNFYCPAHSPSKKSRPTQFSVSFRLEDSINNNNNKGKAHSQRGIDI